MAPDPSCMWLLAGSLYRLGVDPSMMTGPNPAKFELDGATVYIHVTDEASGANVTHLDVEHPDLNEIIEPSESSFVGGKNGGIFVGLKEEMIERAEAYVERHE